MISLSFKEGTAYVITPAVAAIKGNGRKSAGVQGQGPLRPLNIGSCRRLNLRPACTGLPRRLGAIGVQMQCAINRRMPGRRHAKFGVEHVHAPGQP